MRILFLARSLDCGGAERQLVTLAKELARRGHRVAIAVFYRGFSLEKELDGSPVRLIPLNKRSRWDLVSLYRTLLKVVRQERPDVLHGWMSDPNLVASMIHLLYPSAHLFWCLRCANVDMILDRVGLVVSWFERQLSRFVECIVVNSQAGLSHAAAHGFPLDRMFHIPNGIDVERFYFDPSAGQKLRTEWGITPSNKLIGLVGRLDPIKDHVTFLKGAAQLVQDLPETRFVCVGDGPTPYKMKLEALSRQLGLANRVLWAPARSDVRAVYSSLDVVCLCSLSEGFPNAIGEAMACGRHCVVTDVGDCRYLVDDTGIVVPPTDPEALSQGLRLALSRTTEPNLRGRQRIVEHFTVTHLADQTEQLMLRFSTARRPAGLGYIGAIAQTRPASVEDPEKDVALRH